VARSSNRDTPAKLVARSPDRDTRATEDLAETGTTSVVTEIGDLRSLRWQGRETLPQRGHNEESQIAQFFRQFLVAHT
jgi:hypothetical protein